MCPNGRDLGIMQTVLFDSLSWKGELVQASDIVLRYIVVLPDPGTFAFPPFLGLPSVSPIRLSRYFLPF